MAGAPAPRCARMVGHGECRVSRAARWRSAGSGRCRRWWACRRGRNCRSAVAREHRSPAPSKPIADPVALPCERASSSPYGQCACRIASDAQIVHRVDVAGDRIGDRARAGAADRRPCGSSGGAGTISSRYSMMASDWVIVWPSWTSAGISSCGFSALYRGACCWPPSFSRWTKRSSGSMPFRFSAMRARNAAEERK